VPVAPENTEVENPAFDVTPNRYVTGIITEKGVARAPYEESLPKLAAAGLTLEEIESRWKTHLKQSL
jgi:methylthioribose-1-phosphate isomerase